MFVITSKYCNFVLHLTCYVGITVTLGNFQLPCEWGILSYNVIVFLILLNFQKFFQIVRQHYSHRLASR